MPQHTLFCCLKKNVSSLSVLKTYFLYIIISSSIFLSLSFSYNNKAAEKNAPLEIRFISIAFFIICFFSLHSPTITSVDVIKRTRNENVYLFVEIIFQFRRNKMNQTSIFVADAQGEETQKKCNKIPHGKRIILWCMLYVYIRGEML